LNVPPEEQASFRAELVERLGTLRGPDGGRVITEVKLREEWFPGPYMDRIPDLTLTLRDHGFISVLNAATVVAPRQRPSGTHHPHGVVVVSGPGVRAGKQAGLQSILDIAPLLAHSLELPVPEEYEGRFPEAMFEEAFLQERPLTLGQAAAGAVAWEGELAAVSEEDDQAIILERLKSLGYIE
jgi:predicted AlkP superfamily phosphohydrolase/phosphomutase